MDYGNILGVIFENMAKMLPIRTVHDYQQGLRWTLGRAGTNLNPGWKFFIPLVQSVDIIDRTVSSIDLHPQVIRTSDDKQIAVRSGLEYRILDARTYFLNLQDNDAVATSTNPSARCTTNRNCSGDLIVVPVSSTRSNAKFSFKPSKNRRN